MGTNRTLDEILFLDSAYAIALSSQADMHHAVAIRLASEIRELGCRLLTTDAVLLEIGNSLSKLRFRPAAVSLLRSIRSDPRIEVVLLTADLLKSGFDLFQQRSDKTWGLTDCVSFVVMRQRGIRQALTIDEHFEQAGFLALLRDWKE
jgi:uncharacterized protein